MRKIVFSVIVFLLVSTCQSAYAHFGMVIPSDTMVMANDSRKIKVALSFSHPFELIGMDLVKPELWVFHNSKKSKLTHQLKQIKVMDQKAWEVSHRIKRPGSYWFVMEPKPYWESAEDCFIIHYTKTIAVAFGDDDDWDKELGLKTEIVPLSKPFGLYSGNVFQGMVKLDGKVVPFAEVEVEYYNQDGKSSAITDYMITQTTKADKNGIFTYATPRSGWWGFAALNEADFKLKHKKENKSVELGAVLWVKFHNWKE